jgi:hypothetical protein
MKIDDIIKAESDLHIAGNDAVNAIDEMVSTLGKFSPLDELEDAFMIIEDLTNAQKRATLLADRLKRRLEDE